MNTSSLEFSLMMRLRRRRRLPFIGLLSRYFVRRYENSTQPVHGMVHGFPVVLNPGNIYPFIVQDARTFNAPLIELVHQVFRVKGKSLCLLDVGAALGDTVLLLKERCPGHVAKFKCIEGDSEFCGLLKTNTARFNDVEIIQTLLARQPTQIRSLVKHHKGTAAALGDDYITAVDLDSIAAVQNQEIDVLKIDVDGFDGEVLSGARKLLTSAHPPAVIFEWHPNLIKRTGNDPLTSFAALQECGYTRYLWFNNIGTFSHFSDVCSPRILTRESDYLIKVNSRADDHFDVIALPKDSKIDEVELAALEYARNW
jgi:FkbM family methyltransferase